MSDTRPFFGPGDLKPGAGILDVALTQLGVRETAPNRGPMVDVYLHAVGLEPSAGSFPWCFAFAFWCAQQAGLWLPRTASVRAAWERGKAIRVSLGGMGDIAMKLNADGTGHAGIIMSRASITLDTVEGNTNDVGSREGIRVAIKNRPSSYWTGFLRPATLGEDLT